MGELVLSPSNNGFQYRKVMAIVIESCGIFSRSKKCNRSGNQALKTVSVSAFDVLILTKHKKVKSCFKSTSCAQLTAIKKYSSRCPE